MPSPHTSSWQHRGVGLVGKGWGDEEDSLSSRAAGGLEKLLRLCCRGQGQHSSARLAVGLARVVQGWWALLSTCPCTEQSGWLQHWGTHLSPAQLRPWLATGLAWQVLLWGVGPRAHPGALLAGANPCPRLLLGDTGGRWHGVLAGVGGCTDPVSVASPSWVLAHRVQV